MNPNPDPSEIVPDLYRPLRIPIGSSYPTINQVQNFEAVYIDDFVTNSADIFSREFFGQTQENFYLFREEYLKDSCPFPRNLRKRKRSVFENYSTFLVHYPHHPNQR